MIDRQLGKSDLRVSVLGMGCWQYGGGTYWGAQPQQDVNDVVHRALDLGINYFDTAEVYNDGESERSLGIALRGKRDKAIIGSKISTSNVHPSVMREHCEASLRRLGTDYLDLYMLHWPVNPLSVKHFSSDARSMEDIPSVQAVFDALYALQKEGKIRHIGISNHGVRQMEDVRATGVSFVANELAYNLFSRAIEHSILPYCARHEIGVIGYMPLQQGLLAGTYPSIDAMKPMQTRSRHYHHRRGEGTRHGEDGAESEMMTALAEIQSLAAELGVDLITLSLAWAVANPGIATTIVGSRNRQQLDVNVRAALYPISPDVVNRLNKITEPVLHKLGFNPDYYENRERSRIS